MCSQASLVYKCYLQDGLQSYRQNLLQTPKKLKIKTKRCWYIPLISALGKQSQADLYELEASLVYGDSIRLAKAITQRKPVSTNQKIKNKRQERYSGHTTTKAFLKYSLGYWKAQPTLQSGNEGLRGRAWHDISRLHFPVQHLRCN